MTGMYAISIGAHEHRTANKPVLPEGVRVLTDWLRDTGYFTANVVNLPAAMKMKGAGKTDWNFQYSGAPYDSKEWSDLASHQPFYAQVNFQETHRNFRAPTDVDPAAVTLPPYYPEHPVARRDYAQYLDSAIELDRKIGLILGQLEREGLLDKTVIFFFGDNGEAHVRGKQFCYEEGLHVPLIIRWPKALLAPAGFPAEGSTVDRFVEAIDFAPTTLAFTGASKPPMMQGRVLFGPGAEAPREMAFGARDRCDMTTMRLRTVRDARYRYIRNFTPEVPFLAFNAYKEKQYPVWNLLKELHADGKLTPAQDFLCQPRQPEEELYDMEADPHEIRNLIDSTALEHVAARQRLREALEKWIEQSGDRGRLPDPDAKS
jgi:arylsulfatase A-like enzyme